MAGKHSTFFQLYTHVHGGDSRYYQGACDVSLTLHMDIVSYVNRFRFSMNQKISIQLVNSSAVKFQIHFYFFTSLLTIKIHPSPFCIQQDCQCLPTCITGVVFSDIVGAFLCWQLCIIFVNVLLDRLILLLRSILQDYLSEISACCSSILHDLSLHMVIHGYFHAFF